MGDITSPAHGVSEIDPPFGKESNDDRLLVEEALATEAATAALLLALAIFKHDDKSVENSNIVLSTAAVCLIVTVDVCGCSMLNSTRL